MKGKRPELYYRMAPILYLKMKKAETEQHAENRMLKLLEDAGVKVTGWKEASVVTLEDGEES